MAEINIHIKYVVNVKFVETVSRWNVASKNIYKKNDFLFCFQVWDFNISDIFYKIKSLNEWNIKEVVPFLRRNLKVHSPYV